jgi:ATP/maltotriose-dependent transcriptional regulator MalT
VADPTGAASDRLDAGRAAIAAQSWQDAADLLEGELDDPAAEAERLELLAEALWWLGRMEDCIAAGERAFRLHEQRGDQRAAGMAAVWLYERHSMRCRPSIGTAWLQRARRALADDERCVEHGALILREAELAHGAGRLDDAMAVAQRALALGRDLGSRDVEAEALQAMGRILIERGQVHEGLAHLDEAMLLAVEGRLGPYSTGKVYCSLIGACEDVGDLRRAAEWTEATTTWSARHPFALFPGVCRLHHAAVLDRRGAMAAAERELSRACEELLGSHLANAVAAYREVGDIRRRLGDLDGAEAAFARAEELSGGACWGTALLRLAQGQVDQASTILSGCLEGQANPLSRARVLPAVVQVGIAAGDLDAARRAADELEATAAAFENPHLVAAAATARGRLRLAEQDGPGALASLRAALAAWTELEVPYEAATARTLLAQAQRESGDEAAARTSFEQARAEFDRLGAALEAGSAGGPGSSGRDGPSAAGLTGRELEVLALIAGGSSNKDIAAALGLSVKTVSRHVENIFTKAGVSSRAAATAFAFEHGLLG